MDSHQSMLARSNLPCLPWAAPQQLRTATQLHATTSDTCEELKRKHCVKKVLCLGAQCTLQKPSAWGLPWHCPRLCGLVSWLCTEWVVSKQSSKSQATLKIGGSSINNHSSRSSRPSHSMVLVGMWAWKVFWQFALLKLVLRVLASLEFGITLMCRQLFALADLDAWTVVLDEWVEDG